MLSDRWNEIKALVDGALDQPPAVRRAWLTEAATEPTLRDEALAILDADARSNDFLERPALGPGLAALRASAEVPGTGARVGPYEVVRQLGSGGMGHVLLARRADDVYRHHVAIKLVDRATDPSSLRRFRAERQILAGLEHPQIARLYDGGTTDDGCPYLVMEHVEGERIDRYVAAHDLSVRARIVLFRKVLAAVAFAHRSLVVHLDLKPANILVDAQGEPKLLDFGIARLLSSDEGETATLGWRPMTRDYASPEQLVGGRLTTASDVYSLGVVLHELLAGRRPHSRGEARAVDLEAEAAPVPPSGSALPDDRASDGAASLARQLRGDLDAIVLKALRREPAARYASVEQLDEDLRRYLAGLPVLARRGTWRYRSGRFLRRHGLAASLAAALVAAMLAGTVTVLLQARRLAVERDRASLAQADAEKVSGFLTSLLGRFDPGTVEGDQITVPELLDRGTVALEDAETPPAVRARLLNALGVAYQVWGRYDDAERLLREALGLRRGENDSAHAEVAASLHALGEIERRRGNHPAAIARHREALAWIGRQDSGAPAELATAHARLGYALSEAGDLHAAEDHLGQACALRLELFGPEHLASVRCRIWLADVRSQLDEPERAAILALEAIAALERLRPEGHPDLADAWTAVARARLASGATADAGEPLRRVLDVRRATLPTGHVEIAESLNNLAVWHNETGSPEQAVPLLEEALAIVREQLGAENDRAAALFHNLAHANRLAGRFDAAAAAWHRSIGILRRSQPDSHRLMYPLGELAGMLLEQGRSGEALVAAREALARSRQALGPDHERVKRLEDLAARAQAASDSDYTPAPDSDP